MSSSLRVRRLNNKHYHIGWGTCLNSIQTVKKNLKSFHETQSSIEEETSCIYRTINISINDYLKAIPDGSGRVMPALRQSLEIEPFARYSARAEREEQQGLRGNHTFG